MFIKFKRSYNKPEKSLLPQKIFYLKYKALSCSCTSLSSVPFTRSCKEIETENYVFCIFVVFYTFQHALTSMTTSQAQGSP